MNGIAKPEGPTWAKVPRKLCWQRSRCGIPIRFLTCAGVLASRQKAPPRHVRWFTTGLIRSYERIYLQWMGLWNTDNTLGAKFGTFLHGSNLRTPNNHERQPCSNDFKHGFVWKWGSCKIRSFDTSISPIKIIVLGGKLYTVYFIFRLTHITRICGRWVVRFLEAIDIAKPKSDIETLWETSGFLRQSVSWHHGYFIGKIMINHWIWGCRISDPNWHSNTQQPKRNSLRLRCHDTSPLVLGTFMQSGQQCSVTWKLTIRGRARSLTWRSSCSWPGRTVRRTTENRVALKPLVNRHLPCEN